MPVSLLPTAEMTVSEVGSPATEVATPELRDASCPPPLSWRDVTTAFYEERRLHRVTHGGQELSISSFGSGPPLLILGGLLGDEGMFALLAWLLKEEHTCVMFPWRQSVGGCGTRPQEQVAVLAKWVQRAADELGHRTFAMHASSFGGLAALETMRQAPERVRWATLQGAFAARRFSSVERTLIWWAGRSRRTLSELPWAMHVQRQNHQRWFPPVDPSRWEFFEQQAGATPVSSIARIAAVAAHVDLRPALSQIGIPVSIIQAEGDGRVSARSQAELVAGLPHSSQQFLNHCGSLPHVTQPHRLAKIIREFHEEHSRR